MFSSNLKRRNAFWCNWASVSAGMHEVRDSLPSLYVTWVVPLLLPGGWAVWSFKCTWRAWVLLLWHSVSWCLSGFAAQNRTCSTFGLSQELLPVWEPKHAETSLRACSGNQNMQKQVCVQVVSNLIANYPFKFDQTRCVGRDQNLQIFLNKGSDQINDYTIFLFLERIHWSLNHSLSHCVGGLQSWWKTRGLQYRSHQLGWHGKVCAVIVWQKCSILKLQPPAAAPQRGKLFAVCEGSVQRTSAKNPVPLVACGILLCRSWRRSSFNRRTGWKGGRIFWARSFFGWVFATLGCLLFGDRAEWSSFVPWWWGHASDGGELGRLLRSGSVWQVLDPIWDLFVEITHAHSSHTQRV